VNENPGTNLLTDINATKTIDREIVNGQEINIVGSGNTVGRTAGAAVDRGVVHHGRTNIGIRHRIGIGIDTDMQDHIQKIDAINRNEIASETTRIIGQETDTVGNSN